MRRLDVGAEQRTLRLWRRRVWVTNTRAGCIPDDGGDDVFGGRHGQGQLGSSRRGRISLVKRGAA